MCLKKSPKDDLVTMTPNTGNTEHQNQVPVFREIHILNKTATTAAHQGEDQSGALVTLGTILSPGI